MRIFLPLGKKCTLYIQKHFRSFLKLSACLSFWCLTGDRTSITSGGLVLEPHCFVSLFFSLLYVTGDRTNINSGELSSEPHPALFSVSVSYHCIVSHPCIVCDVIVSPLISCLLFHIHCILDNEQTMFETLKLNHVISFP